MSVTDYSKWDRFAREIDETEEDEENKRKAAKVTKLEGPSRVTFGKSVGQDTIAISPALYQSSVETATTSTGNISKAHPQADPSKSSITRDPLYREPRADLCKNGGVNDSYVWSQTREEVIANVFLPADTKGKDIDIAVDEANGTQQLKLAITDDEGQKRILLDGELGNTVEIDEEGEVDWELVSERLPLVCLDKAASIGLTLSPEKPYRLLRLTLKKKPHLGNMTVWWRSFIKGHQELDMAKDIERTKSSLDRQIELQKTWDEAHRLFRERVRDRKPQMIDLDNEES